jgi:tape measure domain-containing protein
MPNLRDITITLTARATQFESELRRAQSSIKSLESTTSTLQSRLAKTPPLATQSATGLRGIGTAASGLTAQLTTLVAGYLSVQGVIQGTTFAVQAASRLETQQRAWQAIAGSAANANQELSFLRATADKLGVTFTGLEQGYRLVAAAAKGTTLEGQATRDIFLAISEAGSRLGLSSDDVTGALRAISQMMSTGVVQADELRNELGNRIPGVMALAAKAMGLTTLELRKQMEAGAVMTDDFLPKFARVMRQQFAGSLEDAQAQSRTLGQEFARAGNVIEETSARLAQDTGLIDWLKNVAKRVADVGEESLRTRERLIEMARQRAAQDVQRLSPTGEAPEVLRQQVQDAHNWQLAQRQIIADNEKAIAKLDPSSRMFEFWKQKYEHAIANAQQQLDLSIASYNDLLLKLQAVQKPSVTLNLLAPEAVDLSAFAEHSNRLKKAHDDWEAINRESARYQQTLAEMGEPDVAKKTFEAFKKEEEKWRMRYPGIAPPGTVPQRTSTIRRAPEAMQPLFAQSGARHGVDPLFLEAMASVESNFNPRAVSPAGAQGMMQFMPATAARYRLKDPFNVEQSIEAAAQYTRDLMALFRNNLELVAAAYNAGEGAVQRYGGIPPYPETRSHVQKVGAIHTALQGERQGVMTPGGLQPPVPIANQRATLEAAADEEQRVSVMGKLSLEVDEQRHAALARLVERLNTVTTAEDAQMRALQLSRAEAFAATADTDRMAASLLLVDQSLKLSTVSLNERERVLAEQHIAMQAALMDDQEAAERIREQSARYLENADAIEEDTQRLEELTLVQRALADVGETLHRVDEQRFETIADILAQMQEGLPTIAAYEEALRKLTGLGAGEGATRQAEALKHKSTDAYRAIEEGATNLSASLENTLIASLTRGGDAWKQFGQIAVEELLRILFQATNFRKTLTGLLVQAGEAILKIALGVSGVSSGDIDLNAGTGTGSFAGDYATGGLITQGQFARVGEQGKELLLSQGTMRLVGRAGPEMIRPRGPAFVIPHRETMTLLRAKSSPVDVIRQMAAHRETGGSMVTGGQYLAGEQGMEGVISLAGARAGQGVGRQRAPIAVTVNVHGVRDMQSFVRPQSQAQIKRAMALALADAQRNT